MKTKGSQLGKPSCWQLIFLQSKVNGAPYNGETLPGESWDWPKDTYFQRRLRLIKILQFHGYSRPTGEAVQRLLAALFLHPSMIPA